MSPEKPDREKANGTLPQKNGNGKGPRVEKRDARTVEVTLPLSDGEKHEDLSVTELLQTAYVTSPSTDEECGHSTDSADGTRQSETPPNQVAGNGSNIHTVIHGQKTIPKTLKLRLIPFEKGRNHPNQMPFPPGWSGKRNQSLFVPLI